MGVSRGAVAAVLLAAVAAWVLAARRGDTGGATGVERDGATRAGGFAWMAHMLVCGNTGLACLNDELIASVRSGDAERVALLLGDGVADAGATDSEVSEMAVPVPCAQPCAVTACADNVLLAPQGTGLVRLAVRDGNSDVVKALLRHGAKVRPSAFVAWDWQLSACCTRLTRDERVWRHSWQGPS